MRDATDLTEDVGDEARDVSAEKVAPNVGSRVDASLIFLARFGGEGASDVPLVLISFVFEPSAREDASPDGLSRLSGEALDASLAFSCPLTGTDAP